MGFFYDVRDEDRDEDPAGVAGRSGGIFKIRVCFLQTYYAQLKASQGTCFQDTVLVMIEEEDANQSMEMLIKEESSMK